MSTLTSLFSDIADAIRAKAGSQATIQASSFPTAIASIQSGGNLGISGNSITKTVADDLMTGGVQEFYLPIVFEATDDYYSAFSSNSDLRIMKSITIDQNTSDHASEMFYGCTSLVEAPTVDFTNVTDCMEMFYDCTSLTTVPAYNTSNVTYMASMFTGCSNLSLDSLNNILLTCANSNIQASDKKLAYILDVSTSYPSVDFTAMSNYSAFVSAGWSIT